LVIRPLTEAESLAYIRQRVAKVALPGGPIFTQDALQAMVRHARGVPRDVNVLCTNVLQAGFWAQQQPITADLVQQVMAAPTGSRSFPLQRLGLTAAAGLLLVAGLLWLAPFSSGPQAPHSNPAVHTPASSETPQPTSVPPLVAPRLQQPEPAPQASAESTLSSAVGPDLGEDHVRLGPLEAPESQRLEIPPAAPTPSAPLIPRITPTPPATSMDTGPKSCDKLKAEIQAKLDAKRITGYTLTIIASGDAKGQHIVGSCEGNTKKIAYNRARNAQ
jgi:general secretion pathway protein A